jgi:REP element-mobilizing transposase RayT
MSEKFKNKYTTKSTRLENYDYSQNGLYFVTICTKDREELFGEIVNEKMILNDVGRIANQFWQKIPIHFPFVNLDEFIVMPNHVHGILEINNDIEKINEIVETQHCCVLETNNVSENVNNKTQQGRTQLIGVKMHPINTKTQQCCVSTVGDDEKKSNTFYKLKPGSLSVIIRSYKSIVSKTVRTQLNPITFAWQPKFYDHIIRNDESLNKIREYIITNPERWERDRNMPENIFM